MQAAQVAACNAEAGLQSARAAEAQHQDSHRGAQQHVAAEKQRALQNQAQLSEAAALEQELRARCTDAAAGARAAEADVRCKVEQHRALSQQIVAHSASPRRHRVTLYDAPSGVGYDAPATQYVYSTSPRRAADQAIACSPNRAHTGAVC